MLEYTNYSDYSNVSIKLLVNLVLSKQNLIQLLNEEEVKINNYICHVSIDEVAENIVNKKYDKPIRYEFLIKEVL